MSKRQIHCFILMTVLTLPLFVFSTPVMAGSNTCVAPPSGMVAWWPGDGNANDIIGGNNSSLVSNVGFAAGEVGLAFDLNGGYVQVPDAPSLDITSQITIDAWIKPSALGGRVVDKITAGGHDGYLLDTYGGVIRFQIGSDSVSGSTSLPIGTWSHIAGVYDGSQMTVYLNGVLDGSLTISIPIPVNSLPLRIGADSNGSSLFSGLIDEVELFNRALSIGEIQAIYNAGSAGKCKPSVTVPTMTEWGIIIFIVLTGLGSVYYLRRQRRA